MFFSILTRNTVSGNPESGNLIKAYVIVTIRERSGNNRHEPPPNGSAPSGSSAKSRQ